jgi:hypothetical protein
METFVEYRLANFLDHLPPVVLADRQNTFDDLTTESTKKIFYLERIPQCMQKCDRARLSFPLPIACVIKKKGTVS